jgi:hypothetical protein
MTTLRRFLVFQILLVWQGGFIFYTAFVVPEGARVLGSAAAQGAITARVTDTLNVLGVIGLIVTAWDLNYTRDPNSRRTATRWWCWVIALLCQGVLLFCHQLLDSFMNPERTQIVIGPPFRLVHQAYLIASTVQWAACLLFAWLTLEAWRATSS